MQSQPDTSELNAIKARMKAMWMAGDFAQIAQYIYPEAEQFIARLKLQPGTRLLDVACGTGNLAIPAARAGAVVTGVDIDTNSLQAARQRAEQERLSIQFDEGDAEELPYPAGQFDVVVSMFGAMFAPRPELAAAEMVRVVRSGGTIAMANWTTEGFIGKSFLLTSRYVPLPPGVIPPVLWGDEKVARERFGNAALTFEACRRELTFVYPFPPAEVVQIHRRHLGPTRVAFARLDDEGKRQLATEMEQLYADHNQGEANQTVIRSEYLEVRVVKA